MVMMNMVQSINLALREEMDRDPSVVLLGEDVGVDGGVFRVTEGLLDRFGTERVIDTPLAEAGIAGVAIGMAMNGLRPVAEVQFMGFGYLTLNQMICHAARMRNRTRGRLTVPMVLAHPIRRGREGVGASFGEHGGPVHPDPRAQGGGTIHAIGGQGPSDLFHS